jgi:septal ring factor EnvC (AmiA/AmiB activator)
MKRTKIPTRVPRATAGDQPATRKMLKLVKDQLSAEIKAVAARIDQMDARFKGVDARFSSMEGKFRKVDARFKSIDARFKSIDARFKSIDAKFKALDAKIDDRFATLSAQIHRTNLLIEEQHANNRIVLEGLQALWQRQDRLEGLA